MPELILKIALPLVGLIIILLCIGAYFFSYGTNLKDSTQEIKMLGAEMKISIITVFILVGLIFIFSGTYLTVINTNASLTKIIKDEQEKSSNYRARLAELNGQVSQLKLSQNKTIKYYLNLKGETALPDPKNLKIFYTVWGDEDKVKPLDCSLTTANAQSRLMVTIQDIKPESFITSLVVEDIARNKKWKVSGFFPLSPALDLVHTN